MIFHIVNYRKLRTLIENPIWQALSKVCKTLMRMRSVDVLVLSKRKCR